MAQNNGEIILSPIVGNTIRAFVFGVAGFVGGMAVNEVGFTSEEDRLKAQVEEAGSLAYELEDRLQILCRDETIRQETIPPPLPPKEPNTLQPTLTTSPTTLPKTSVSSHTTHKIPATTTTIPAKTVCSFAPLPRGLDRP